MHKFNRLQKLISLISLAVFLLLPVSSYAAETGTVTEDYTVTVSYGIDNSAKGGRYLPLRIEFHNSTTEDFSGTAGIYVNESDNETYEYLYDVDISAGSTTLKSYYIPLGVHSYKIRVELIDKDGTTVSTQDVALGIDTSTAQLFIGVLSDTPEQLKYFDDKYIDYGLVHTKTFNLSADNFPEDAKGLDQFDIILISNYRLRDLSENQSRVLMDWVKAGGIMMLGTGERVEDTLGRFAPELLESSYDEPELCEVDLGGGIAMNGPMDGIEELYCVYAPLHGANVIMAGDSFPILSSSNKEMGLVVIAAYDFCDVADFASTHSDFAENILTRSLGTKRLDDITKDMYGSAESKFSYVQSLVNTGDVDKLPPIGLYSLSIIAYILLAGPGLYLFLKQRGNTKYYRSGVILLAISFAVIVYLMGSRTRFTDTFYNYATIRDGGEDSVSETTFLNLRNPYSKEYDVDIDGSYSIRPVTVVSYDNVSADENLSEDPSVRVAYQTAGTNVTVSHAKAFDPTYFELQKSESNEEGLSFSGDIYLFEDKISGSISNNFGCDVQDGVILFYGRMVLIGDMADGETISLDDKPVINIPLAESDAVASIVSGLDEYDTEDALDSDYLRALEEKNLLSFYRDYYMNGYSADARLLGFAATQTEDGIVQDDLTDYGVTMLTSLISVDSRDEDDRIYRSALVNGPRVISGEYYSEANTVDGQEPAVLEYELGNDLQIEKMLLEWPDERFSGFNGTVSWYNYTTGSYDTVDVNKSEYSSEELRDYLSPSNSMRVRYSYSGDAYQAVNLPLISVVGTER